jgi:DNA polymerase-3 subunit beta
LINGKYPEYRHIIPEEFKTRGIMEKEIIQSAVKMASFFSFGKANEIKLKIDPEKRKATIEAKSAELGENSAESKADVVGPSQEVIFNSRYLLDGINTLASSKVAILINTGSSPVALRETDEKTGEITEDFVYIVMPIKN